MTPSRFLLMTASSEDSMMAREALLRPPPVGHVDQHVDGADQDAGRVVQRLGERHEADAAAVRPLGVRLHAGDGPVLLDGHRHRALIVRHRRAVEPIQPPGAAPPAVAQGRPVAPQLDRRRVVVGDAALGVRHIDGGGQGFDHLMEIGMEGRRNGARGGRDDGRVERLLPPDFQALGPATHARSPNARLAITPAIDFGSP